MATGRPFVDRADAGRRLAAVLKHLRGHDPVILGLPRGGVPVASEVATVLHAELDVIVVRKLGLPMQPEVAMGAIGEGGYEVLDRLLIAHAGVTERQVRGVEERERQQLRALVRRLRRGRPPHDLRGRIAIVVDDGLATGATARVACRAARQRGASRIVLAVPVGPTAAARSVPEADEVVCLLTPQPFVAVGCSYVTFRPTADEVVLALLDAADRAQREAS